MTASGDYYRQATLPMDYFPIRELELGDYRPDVLRFVRDGGIDSVIGHEESVIALRSIQHDERFERAQRQLDQSGENI